MDRAKNYLILSAISLALSYVTALVAASDGTAMAVWYCLTSIATGLSALGFGIATAFKIFGWDD